MLREGRGGGGGDLDEFFCRFDQEKRDRIVVFLLYGISNFCDCCLTVVSGKCNRSNGQFKFEGEISRVARTEWCEGIHCRKRIDVAIHRDAVYPFQLYYFT